MTPRLATAAAQVQPGATGAALVLLKSRMGQPQGPAAPGALGQSWARGVSADIRSL